MKQECLKDASLSSIVMAFNEAGSLESVVREIDVVSGKLLRRYEIIIVDDGSSDGTGKIADRLAGELKNVRVIHHEKNKGVGEVYRSGFTAARGNLITFFPADGQFPAGDVTGRFLSAMDKADIALGYLPDDTRSLPAKALSGAEKLLFRLFLGPTPKFQGVMMFKKDLLDRFELGSWGRGWVVLTELIVKAERAGHRIVSVPTALRERISGKSKVRNFSTILSNLTQLVRLRLQLKETAKK